ncbi:hypothetical protein D9M71_791750 [compost metagenome]
MAFLSEFDRVKDKQPAALRQAVTDLIQGEAFRSVTGPGANSREKLKARIELTVQAILAAQ